jgi:hypothetical protein
MDGNIKETKEVGQKKFGGVNGLARANISKASNSLHDEW